MEYLTSFILLFIIFIVCVLIANLYNSTYNLLRVNSISTGTIFATGDIKTNGSLKAGTIESIGPLKAGNIESTGPLKAGTIESIGPLKAGTIESIGPLKAGNIESTGNINAGVNIYARDINSVRNLNSGLDISAKGNAFIDGYINAKGHIHTNSTLKASGIVLESNGISTYPLTVDDDNKIYKYGKVWNNYYTTPDNWVQPENSVPNSIKDFNKDSVENSHTSSHQWQWSCNPNQYVCGIDMALSGKNINHVPNTGPKINPDYAIFMNMRCCDFPEGFPGRYPDEQK